MSREPESNEPGSGSNEPEPNEPESNEPGSRSNEPESNVVLEIIQGFLLLMVFHGLAAAIIFAASVLLSPFFAGYAALSILIIGTAGFLFWQLLYVIPLIIVLRRRRKINRMKGVIIGAVLTALVNGACFLAFFRP